MSNAEKCAFLLLMWPDMMSLANIRWEVSGDSRHLSKGIKRQFQGLMGKRWRLPPWITPTVKKRLEIFTGSSGSSWGHQFQMKSWWRENPRIISGRTKKRFFRCKELQTHVRATSIPKNTLGLMVFLWWCRHGLVPEELSDCTFAKAPSVLKGVYRFYTTQVTPVSERGLAYFSKTMLNSILHLFQQHACRPFTDWKHLVKPSEKYDKGDPESSIRQERGNISLPKGPGAPLLSPQASTNCC